MAPLLEVSIDKYRPVHPPLIDGHSPALVGVLGVVYRADMVSLTGHLKSYAVQGLMPPPTASPTNAASESPLHQLASELFHSIISKQHTIAYIILDYPPLPSLHADLTQLQVLGTTS
jgi:hypothetical protein